MSQPPQRTRGPAPRPVWVTLALNPLTETLTVHGLSKSQIHADLKRNRADEDSLYRRSFDLMESGVGNKLRDWFRECGIVSTEANELVRQFGRNMAKMLEEIGPPSSRREPR